MLPDRVSNPGPLTYESGALPIALRGPAFGNRKKSLGARSGEWSGCGSTCFALQHPLQLCECGLSCCPVAAKHLLESLPRRFHDWRSSAGLA